MLAAATDAVALEATTAVVVAVTAAVAQRDMPRGLAAAPPFLRFLVTLVVADKFALADVVLVDLRVEELPQEEETEVAAMKLRTLLNTEERRKVAGAAVAQIGNTGLRYLAKTASFEWQFADLWLLLTEDLLVLLLALCLPRKSFHPLSTFKYVFLRFRTIEPRLLVECRVQVIERINE